MAVRELDKGGKIDRLAAVEYHARQIKALEKKLAGTGPMSMAGLQGEVDANVKAIKWLKGRKERVGKKKGGLSA